MFNCKWVGFLLLTWCLCWARSGWAAITPGGDTLLADTPTQSTFVGNAADGTLTIDGGSVLGDMGGWIGYGIGVNGVATVSGLGSAWINTSDLQVGAFGTGTLNILQGVVSNKQGYVGFRVGSSGSVVVSGNGAQWNSASNLYIGFQAPGTLTVKDGGAVTAISIYASLSSLLGNGTISANGAVLDGNIVFDSSHGTAQAVSFGSGGTLNLNVNGSGALGAGHNTTGTLQISDGVAVSSTTGYIGFNPTSVGSATISGAGSKWNNSGNLYVGYNGSGTMNVNGGGEVTARTLYASPATLTGNGTISANGAVLDGNLVFDATHATTQVLTFGTGGTLNLSVNGTGDLGVGYKGSGSLRIADGVTISSSAGYLGFSPGATGTAIVTGSGTKWLNTGSMYVGYTGAGTLTIEGSAQVSSLFGYIGYNTTGTTSVAVSGSGSTWTNSAQLFVGDSGTGSMSISAGGQVNNTTGYIAFRTGSTGAVTVSGAGSVWNNSDLLYVGYLGNGSLTIDSGAVVNSLTGYLGYKPGTSGNVLVTGANSKWISTGRIQVGLDGSGTLTISNGGNVTAKTIYASMSDLRGDGTISANGVVLDASVVFDSTHGTTQSIPFGTGGSLNLTTSSAGDLGAGYKGTGSLSISSGRALSSTFGYVGFHPGSNGTVTVSGTGSKWTTSNALRLGYKGTGTLNILVGGQVSNADGEIGSTAGANGAAVVSGTNSKWTSSGILYVGYSGNGSLTIDSAGQVTSNSGQVGYGIGSSGTATVTGTGSKWIVTNSLYVGRLGSGTLSVSNGGTVTANTLYGAISNLQGNGTITTNGVVADGDVILNAAGTDQTFGSGGILHLNLNGTGTLGAGFNANGTLSISGGAVVSSSGGLIGTNAGSSGAVTVTGAGSRWNITGGLAVGASGAGRLTVSSGASVSTKELSTALSSLQGDGAITTNGIVLGGNLRFDASHGTTQTVPFGSGGSLNLVINGSTTLGVGYKGNGQLQIADGVVVNSIFGKLGSDEGSTGTALVSGVGTTWNISNVLYVGDDGNGALFITRGGKISDTSGYLATGSTSTGRATVSGAGSMWMNSADLHVGNSQNGTLTVADNALITADKLYVTSFSATQLRVSGNGMIVLGDASTTGLVNNNGTIAFYADATLPAGTYAPITEFAGRAISWTGTGTYSAVGGTWDSNAHTFTVTTPTALPAGTAHTLVAGERLTITDSGSGRHMSATFGAEAGGLSFAASPMSQADINAVLAIMGPDHQVVGAWNFTTDFVRAGEVLLTFDIGAGFESQDLTVWHLQDGVWSQYVPNLLTYDASGMASFTVTSFSGYAVAVPEPSVGILVAVGIAVLRRRRIRQPHRTIGDGNRLRNVPLCVEVTRQRWLS